MPWDPIQYEKFQSERSAPFYDLMELVEVKERMNCIDLGCGTGQLTRVLTDRLPSCKMLGIDSSSSMLEDSEKFAGNGLVFDKRSIEDLDSQWDLVFSNAAIQWVPSHEELIPKLLSHVRTEGQLVVQLPSNHTHPAHLFILELAQSTPYREALDGWVRIPPVLSIEQYGQLLFEAGAVEINVIEKIYPHVLENADAIADWTSGTALVPYFERFSSELREAFMNEYRAKLLAAFPQSPVFYPFKRILFSARKQ